MFISVVIPTHNRLRLLRDAIETVERQEFADWELVVFDNASEDPIRAHVQSLKDDRVRYFRSDEFLPVTSSWNRSIEFARGDYVVLLGDDDGLTPHYFKRVREIVEKFDRPDVVYNNIYQFWHPGVAPWEPAGHLIDVKHGFFFTNRHAPFRLTEDEARHAALGSIRLRINFSFNSQAFIYNRAFLRELSADGPVYRSPFPDYYIANVALMRSRSTVVVPEPLAVAGVSKASFGFTIYNNLDDRGAALLNTDLGSDPVYREIESRLLPGPAYNTNFVVAMEYVARALPQLGATVDFQRYRRIQIHALLTCGMRGEKSGTTWAEMRGHLSLAERLWAASTWRILRLSGRFPIVESRLLPKVQESVSMSGFDPLVRHCGNHNWSRVTDLYDALAADALPLTNAASGSSLLFYPEIATQLNSAVSSSTRRIDPALVSRIRRAYHLAVERFEGYGKSAWKGIVDQSGDLHGCLMKGSDGDLGRMLARPGDTNLFYGYDALVRGTDLSGEAGRPWALYTFDCIVRLAEATLAICIFNRDGADTWPISRANTGPEDVESLLRAIDQRLGIKLDFPNPFPNEGGLATERGIATYRSPHAIYQAWRIRSLARQVHSAKVLEIGAGLGRTAYYARALGLSSYTIVDLPMTNVAQALFLGQVLGPEAIWVPGDPAESQVGRIRIHPPSWFAETTEHFDVVLNVDSMTEMDRGHAAVYVEKISRMPCTFLSINHESNAFTVHELCDPESLVGRYPYWLRKGYVEELFAFGTSDRLRG